MVRSGGAKHDTQEKGKRRERKRGTRRKEKHYDTICTSESAACMTFVCDVATKAETKIRKQKRERCMTEAGQRVRGVFT